MSDIYFTRWLAILSVGGGVLIALGLPAIVLLFGSHLSAAVQLTAVILGLLAGTILAVASTVIGITIPTAVKNGGLDLGRIMTPGRYCPGEGGATTTTGDGNR